MSKLLKEARKLSHDKEVISFDLFDTLLIRRIHDPDVVKAPVARFIKELAWQKGIKLKANQIGKVRDEVEKRHRTATGQKYVDHEACYPQFMQETLKSIFGNEYNDVILDQVTEFELKMENSMLVVREDFRRWMVELHEANKRIIVISDMYLPASHLEKLVAHAGLSELIEAVISSADTFLAKASGGAYKMIEERYRIEPAHWLHIGDNPISDGLRASEAGIRALVIHDPREDQRKAIVRSYYGYSLGKPFWRGRTLQQLMMPLEGENQKKSSLYIEGYNFIGPLLGLFTQSLAEHCRNNEITKIFFLSREGWLLKKYWEKVQPFLFPAGGSPNVDYLYVSRMALAGPSCAYQGLTKENAKIALMPIGNRDFRDVCRIFSLDQSRFLQYLGKYDLEPDTCLSQHHEGFQPDCLERFFELLSDNNFQEEVKRQTLPANQALQRYLIDAELFEHKRVAIVDIGWLGTIQRFLYEAISHRDDCPHFHGYLFGATRGIQYPTTEKNSINGLIYDRDRIEFAASNLHYAQDIFEEGCRAPHPTLNGYALKDDGYELVFRRTDDEIGAFELEQDNYYADMRAGILASASRYGAAASLLGYDTIGYKPWFNYLMVSKLAFPTANEVSVLRNKHHLDEFNGNKKPISAFSKNMVGLWDRGQGALRFNPFLRVQYFIRQILARLEE
jgi:predicted HAD superfamily hydrolase